MTWQDNAACKGMDPSVFYLEPGQTSAPSRAVCARCPVVDRCAATAVASGEQYGIWGGMSPVERGVRKIRLPNKPKTHCVNGHPFTDTNTRINAQGHRRCRTCLAEQARRTG